MLIATFTQMEFNGLSNIKLGGQDLQINNELSTAGIFTRGITLSCFNELKVPAIDKQRFINIFKLNFKMFTD